MRLEYKCMMVVISDAILDAHDRHREVVNIYLSNQEWGYYVADCKTMDVEPGMVEDVFIHPEEKQDEA